MEGAVAASCRGLEQVICAGLEDVDFRSESISRVGMFDVLEHVQDDVGALRHIVFS